MQTNNDDITNKLIFNKYKLEEKLGQGSFGMIYVATCQSTGEKYALKMETKNLSQSLLETEAYILCHLKGYGIPGVKSFGLSNGYNVLVMELLGSSLETLFQSKQKKFSLKTVCMIGLQMIDRMEWIHSKKIVHRDIKPENFVLGKDEKSHIIYLLDFGLSKKYWSSKTQKHLAFSINTKLTGTARYASINALRGCEQSRRDDLEAVGYVLAYFLRGDLPWQGLKVVRREERYKKIYEKKKNTTAEEIFEGFPSEFMDYIKYTRDLEFEAIPDYNYLKRLIKNVMMMNNFEFDYFFDWCESKPVINEEYLPNNEEITIEDEAVHAKMEEEKTFQINEDKGRLDSVMDNYNVSIPRLDGENKETGNGNDNQHEDKGKGKKKKKCLIF